MIYQLKYIMQSLNGNGVYPQIVQLIYQIRLSKMPKEQ